MKVSAEQQICLEFIESFREDQKIEAFFIIWILLGFTPTFQRDWNAMVKELAPKLQAAIVPKQYLK